MLSFVPDEDSPYTIDECKIRGHADLVFIPENENDIKEILLKARDEGKTVTVSSMRTGMCGGGVPNGGYLISLERFNRFIGIGKDDGGYYLRLQSCVTIENINNTLSLRRTEGFIDITENAVNDFRNDTRSFFYPVDPTERNGSVGGNIATNASGPRTYKYGPTRNWIKFIRVILPTGETVNIERGKYLASGRKFDTVVDGIEIKTEIPTYEFNKTVKNAAGIYVENNMDLIDLFIGSEGLFGIITEAEIRLTEWHPLISNIIFMPGDDSALALINDLRNDTYINPEFIEYFDTGSIELIRKSYSNDPTLLNPPEGKHSAVFIDLSLTEDIEERYDALFSLIRKNNGNPDISWIGYEDDDRKRMFQFRHCVPKSVFDYVASLKEKMPRLNKMGTDMSVPQDRFDEMMIYYKDELEKSGLEYVIFGHLGNCHPHVEIILKDEDDLEKARTVYRLFAKKAIELGGSPSAEHGIGKLKSEYIEIMYGTKGVEEMKNLKLYFDPLNMLNRGNIIG